MKITGKIGIAGPISTEPLIEYLNLCKVQHVPSGLGGSLVVHVVGELLRRGHEVSVYSLDSTIESSIILEGDNLTIFYGPWRLGKRMRDMFKAERAYLKEAILKDDPAFVHAYWTYEYAMAALASGKPNLITCQDSAFRVVGFNKDLYRFGRLLMNLYVLRKAARLTAVSPYTREAVKPFARGSITVVPNGIQDEIFHKDRDKMLNTSCPTVATILNGWGKRKNPKLAIKAFSLLKKRVPGTRLLMFGYGFEDGGPAEEWARSGKIREGIEFIGPVPYCRLMQQLDERKVDVLLHPALEETFGMVLIEAMAKRIPVIGGVESGGVPWVLSNGAAGLLVDVTSPEEIAEAMFRLVSDRALWTRYSEAGYESVRKRFHIEVVVDQYEELYQQLV